MQIINAFRAMLKPARVPALAIARRSKTILPPGMPCPRITAQIATDEMLLELLDAADFDMRHGRHPTEQHAAYARYCSTTYYLAARSRGILHEHSGIVARSFSGVRKMT